MNERLSRAATNLATWFKGLSATNQRLIIAIPVLVALYYVMSPYQNCMSEGRMSSYGCAEVTSW